MASMPHNPYLKASLFFIGEYHEPLSIAFGNVVPGPLACDEIEMRLSIV